MTMSTTATKKGIVDFLWEWAESQGDWAKLLIQKIVSSETCLSTSERQEVFNYFLQSIALLKGLPALSIAKPSYSPTGMKIELTSLSDVSGVNRLAKDQTILFCKNITIIYGENGTGKTGYGRILKSLGYSYDPNNNILSNIYDKQQSPKATIRYKVDDVEISTPFVWNGTNKNAELQNISVFNSNCVSFSFQDNRQLLVSPIGFHLFNLVTDELNSLSTLLNATKTSLPTNLSWASTLNENTPQQKYIVGLTDTSPEYRLLELSAFTTINGSELLSSEKSLSNLNKALLEKEIQTKSTSQSELETILEQIQRAQKVLSKSCWEQLIEINKQIGVLEKTEQKGIKEIAELNGITFYETAEFQIFIKAAEDYVKLLEKPEYPQEKDVCVYCLQPLNSKSKELLSNYRTLLNNTTQQQLVGYRKLKKDLIEQVSNVDTNIIFHQTAFGVDDNQNPIQPKELIDYNTKLGKLKGQLMSGTISESTIFDFEYEQYICFLTEKISTVGSEIAEMKITVRNLATTETELKAKIAELKDRKLLFTKVEEVKTTITNHRTISLLNNNSGKFNTYSISKKTTEAREELVKSDFETKFKEELISLRKAHINIDLNFGTERGTSKVSNKIASYNLIEVLSEGEQKAIALAEFLTELQLDNTKAPVIFDDPVNSLDHHIIDDVARRLLKLSLERQVVIFTHSILLFNNLLYMTEQPLYKGTITSIFYNSRNEYGETGYISEIQEKTKLSEYIKWINIILNNTPKDRPETLMAEDGYGYLRSAIELFVEMEIFKGTVKRYQKNVALTQFVKVDGNLINAHKITLNEIFERCCGFIKGHSSPNEAEVAPTLVGLKQDFEEFNRIKKAFVG